jgi:hypothetical protein
MRLSIDRGRYAATVHQQQNKRRTQFVSQARVQRLLVVRIVERPEPVEFRVDLQFLGHFMPHHKAGDLAIRPHVNRVVALAP